MRPFLLRLFMATVFAPIVQVLRKVKGFAQGLSAVPTSHCGPSPQQFFSEKPQLFLREVLQFLFSSGVSKFPMKIQVPQVVGSHSKLRAGWQE